MEESKVYIYPSKTNSKKNVTIRRIYLKSGLPRGRKPTISQPTYIRMCQSISNGLTIKFICELNDVSYESFRRARRKFS